MFMLLTSLNSYAQSIPDTTVNCNPGQVTLGTNIPPFVPPISTNITGDDSWGAAVPIGFTFNFFGNNYTQVVPSSNGVLTFNLASAGNFCAWSIGTTGIPNNAYHLNSIMGPWEDLYPPAGGGTATYGTIGTAPNRIFIFQLCQMPFYS